jgi:hypothetical protein
MRHRVLLCMGRWQFFHLPRRHFSVLFSLYLLASLCQTQRRDRKSPCSLQLRTRSYRSRCVSLHLHHHHGLVPTRNLSKGIFPTIIVVIVSMQYTQTNAHGEIDLERADAIVPSDSASTQVSWGGLQTGRETERHASTEASPKPEEMNQPLHLSRPMASKDTRTPA